MKQYETYKDSGIEWIGEIPEHWEIVPLKYRFAFSKGLSITKEDLVSEGVPVISYGQVHSKVNPGTTTHDHLLRFVPSTTTNKFESAKVNVGDFIFADTSEDLEGCGNCAYIDRDGIYAGYHTIVFHSLYPSDNKYLAYLFLTDEWRSQIRSSVMGTKVYSITQNILSKVSIILPPQEEQARIAAWLDWKIGQVDAIVTEKEAMVADLQSYRQSLITEAVTYGLNSNCSLCNSHIDWIKMIPSNWRIIPLKYRFALSTGLAITKADLINEGVPVISYGQVHSKLNSGTSIQEHLLRYVPKSLTEGKSSAKVALGDFIFADTSEDLEGCGNCAYIDRDGIYAGYHTVVFHSLYPGDNKYLAYLFLTDEWRSQIRRSVMGTKVYSVTQNILSKVSIILPPPSEQKEIAEFLDHKTAEIDALLSDLREQITDLRSYKASLISEAVTGKIDLRDWEPQN